jgi:hypothetical protein
MQQNVIQSLTEIMWFFVVHVKRVLLVIGVKQILMIVKVLFVQTIIHIVLMVYVHLIVNVNQILNEVGRRIIFSLAMIKLSY